MEGSSMTHQIQSTVASIAKGWEAQIQKLLRKENMDRLKALDFEMAHGELLASVLGICVLRVVYNLYFHPLAGFPGPFWARASLLWRFWHTMGGRSHRSIQQMHQRYGPVFRVSPNELSFGSVNSWKAIYGFPSPGAEHLIKGEFYDIYGSGFKTGCIGSERDPAVHARKKRNLTADFSPKALAAQESIVQGCLDRFVDKLGPLTRKGGGKGINMADWLEMVAFDILGEMAFGEGFGCVEKEDHHAWLDLILGHLFEITVVDNLRRVQFLAALGRWLLPWLTVRVRKKHSMFSRAKVKQRLEAKTARQDFLTNLVSKVHSGAVPEEEMTAHASTLIIAGGETTATCMVAAVYYLLKSPPALEKLASEIRTRYTSYSEIDANSALQLPYLQAVINEALRIHPPGSQGFPRVSPGCEIDGFWVPKGAEVYTSAWTVTHDPKNFHEPMEFKPERWLDQKTTDVKEASQPFSLGYRACIGRNFAYLEMASCLSKILFKYDMELVNHDLNWEAASRCYVMWWKAPVMVSFKERLHEPGIMMLSRLFSLSLLGSLVHASCPASNRTAAAIAACNALAASFPTQLYLPNTTDFIDQAAAIWSQTCLITPNCVLEAGSASDVATAVKLINAAGSEFAVRSGGHMPVPGAQSVQPGVMISMSGLNQNTLNTDKSVASIGPGQTWIDVYSRIIQYGLAVNGGRYPSVGVGGLLVGGGIGFFSSTRGWRCDSVVAYEVVLANGHVVTATAEGDYADLFWALRGGHNHFGIVTRFDVLTFPAGPAFARTIAWNASAGAGVSDAFFDALDAYMAPGGGVDDPDVAIIPTVAFAPGLDLYEVITAQIAFGTDPAPAAFENFTKIDGPTTLDDGGKVFDSWTWLPLALNGTSSRDTRDFFWAVSFKPDPRAISIANKTVIDLAVGVLPATAAVAFTYQPVSKAWLTASQAAGGNVLGLDPEEGTIIAGLIAGQWVDPADDDVMFAFARNATAEIERQTKELGLYHPFIYLNDAGPGQKPFAAYGSGKSLPKLLSLQKKYDPKGFFKNYLAHGFALES
ncbi:cytochrome P450 [Phialemonium atrogriseum]|uniref:Cytochrome P450 n=1 Tax=Phialemonium atrogriseum TaxID=1093897 RepID=A0AAJ0FRX2_9PEZI|nr:cytochrome P450 [Phialemonium atrogriseum]KAK1772874.1 cytochrome P450 [Phialemonium atrogriseum]